MVRKVIIFVAFIVLFIFFPGSIAAQEKVPDTEYAGKERWAYKTNALEWLLTIPNFGVEYDLSKSVYNRMTIGVTAKYNWNTSHNYATPMVFNLTEFRPEFRYYWRHTQKTLRSPDDTSKVGFGQWLRENIFTTDRKNPKDWRACYIGGYLSGGGYSVKLGKEGRQGQLYGIGVTFGYGIPLYQYEKGAVDLDLGMSVGLALTKYDAFAHNPDGDYYTVLPESSKGLHIVPFPVISELKVAFVFRKRSIDDKYKRVDQEKLREKMDRRDRKAMQRDSLQQQRALDREKLAAEKAAAAEERRLSDTPDAPVVQPAEPSSAEKAAGRPAKSGKEKISREKKEKPAKESGFMKLFRKKSDVKEEEEQ